MENAFKADFETIMLQKWHPGNQNKTNVHNKEISARINFFFNLATPGQVKYRYES